jgi:hypothetical protein
VRGTGTEILVTYAYTWLECLDELVNRVGRGRPCKRARGECDAVFLIGENRRANRGQLEPIPVVVIEKPRRSLILEPFEQPTFVKSGSFGEFGCRDGSGSIERGVESESISDLNHQGNDLSLFEVPYVE